MERRGTLARVVGVSLLLFGCGSTDSEPPWTLGSAGSGAVATSNDGASLGGASDGGSGGASAAGASGADAEPIGLVPNQETLWGMFAFEDPVEVVDVYSARRLTQLEAEPQLDVAQNLVWTIAESDLADVFHVVATKLP